MTTSSQPTLSRRRPAPANREDTDYVADERANIPMFKTSGCGAHIPVRRNVIAIRWTTDQQAGGVYFKHQQPKVT